MEVEVTSFFVRSMRRYGDRALVRNSLRRLRNQMANSSSWLSEVERLNTSAVERCFRFKVTDGDRLIASHQPPLKLLDYGKHDDALNRWNKGKTKASVQINRADEVIETPEWVAIIFAETTVKNV